MKTDPLDDGLILLVDKPADWTSHDVVGFVRGFGIRKVGHCGTLDPAATGLLVLVMGKATKLTDRFNTQDKVYEGEMCLGIETHSQDAQGEVTRRGDWSGVSPEQVRAVCAEFVGAQLQIPPMVSAKKVNGKRLYKYARKGIEIDRPPKSIVIHHLDIREIELPMTSIAVKCSKGTYIRTLCHDIGRRLGCGAHLHSLRRIQSGDFDVADAYAMPEIRQWDRDELIRHCISVPDLMASV